MDVTAHRDDGAGRSRPVLVWRFDPARRAISSAVSGGGIGPCAWIVNAEVAAGYRRGDPAGHLEEIAAELGLPVGRGVGLMTAASVVDVSSSTDEGVACDATVGVALPTWAAAPAAASAWVPGTINLVCDVPAPLDDAALVNAVLTATEAKAQAMIESGLAGTGTASDAIVVCCPPGGGEPYCGPRSRWGSRLARAVHAAVGEGIGRSLERIG